MLTFLSRSIRQLLDLRAAREPAQALRALPPPAVSACESSGLPALPSRARLHVVAAAESRDTDVAPAAQVVGATAFVAGQGARIYSLDAFRPRRGPHHPKAA